jgi:heme/copper-type cytochrome/quinol oxidase subunit 3
MSTAVASTVARKPAVSNVVLGTVIFVITEVMFFTALISAYLVIRAGAGLRWVPPPDVRLPVEATALNTIALLVSGVLMVLATSLFARANAKARLTFLGAMILGIIFVIFQGREWLQLISIGLTMMSGVFGATFFLLIGTHGLHALSAILAMIYIWFKMGKGSLQVEQLRALTVYWLFIVSIWPVLYRLVYF